MTLQVIQEKGGLFTRTLEKVVLSPTLEGRARQGSVGWGKFFPVLQREKEVLEKSDNEQEPPFKYPR